MPPRRTQQAADRAQQAIKDSTKALKVALLEQEPPMPNVDELVKDDEGDMFFTGPEQLLKIYHELEETNLFLIQNAQVRFGWAGSLVLYDDGSGWEVGMCWCRTVECTPL